MDDVLVFLAVLYMASCFENRPLLRPLRPVVCAVAEFVWAIYMDWRDTQPYTQGEMRANRLHTAGMENVPMPQGQNEVETDRGWGE